MSELSGFCDLMELLTLDDIYQMPIVDEAVNAIVGRFHRVEGALLVESKGNVIGRLLTDFLPKPIFNLTRFQKARPLDPEWDILQFWSRKQIEDWHRQATKKPRKRQRKKRR